MDIWHGLVALDFVCVTGVPTVSCEALLVCSCIVRAATGLPRRTPTRVRPVRCGGAYVFVHTVHACYPTVRASVSTPVSVWVCRGLLRPHLPLSREIATTTALNASPNATERDCATHGQ